MKTAVTEADKWNEEVLSESTAALNQGALTSSAGSFRYVTSCQGFLKLKIYLQRIIQSAHIMNIHTRPSLINKIYWFTAQSDKMYPKTFAHI